MKVTISDHAKKQAKERGITEDGIMGIIAENPVTSIPSKFDPCAYIVLGKYENNVWAVITNYDTFNVITVRRASKIERRYYEEEQRNRPDIL